MPLTEIFNKAFAKVILQIIGVGSAGYGLWLLNPLNTTATASVIKLALSTASLEVIIGILLIVAAGWFVIAVHREWINHMRKTSMFMLILWLFFLIIYLTTNPWLAVVPLSAMFVVLFGYVFIKSPKRGR